MRAWQTHLTALTIALPLFLALASSQPRRAAASGMRSVATRRRPSPSPGGLGLDPRSEAFSSAAAITASGVHSRASATTSAVAFWHRLIRARCFSTSCSLLMLRRWTSSWISSRLTTPSSTARLTARTALKPMASSTSSSGSATALTVASASSTSSRDAPLFRHRSKMRASCLCCSFSSSDMGSRLLDHTARTSLRYLVRAWSFRRRTSCLVSILESSSRRHVMRCSTYQPSLSSKRRVCLARAAISSPLQRSQAAACAAPARKTATIQKRLQSKVRPASCFRRPRRSRSSRPLPGARRSAWFWSWMHWAGEVKWVRAEPSAVDISSMSGQGSVGHWKATCSTQTRRLKFRMHLRTRRRALKGSFRVWVLSAVRTCANSRTM
mmetsp:Transcript_115416/g.248041  ORF Transcript_115416/g.248041 Transcript_115416/m.248041 type:complete len:382 (-) Transcript_115416:159-1304(-)